MNHRNFGLFFEDFFVGQIFDHWPGKTITESDNNLFTLITMNHHPVHLDKVFAESQQHHKILVVGTLVFSLVVGLTVADISGKAIANLDYEDIKHLGPVFIGDTIYAKSKIINSRESNSKKDRGIIHVKTEAYNQDNNKILSFKRHILIPKKS
jgi:acyl dehydratase